MHFHASWRHMLSLKLPSRLRQPGRSLSGSLQPYHLVPPRPPRSQRYSSSHPQTRALGPSLDSQEKIDAFLANPTWSIESLIPTPATSRNPPVSVKKLRHLLRLSALPEPNDSAEEATMIQTLASQLHFLSAIRSVDTTGVSPLRALRDETVTAEQEQEITMEKLMEHLKKEKIVGTHYKRIRRVQEKVEDKETPKSWKPLDHAQHTNGKFFTVDGTTVDHGKT